VQKHGEAFWCFADSLAFSSDDLSEEGTSPFLGSNVGKAFISVKESVWVEISMCDDSARISAEALVEGLFPG
jgi:hypothetical protein